ncbi:ABC-2 type transport system permease protein [Salsuginibacillus halophilus]|uniref:ABC-2 type transport system permease protein n=1 Tax=Salsuginibacillus halophilus TaxID=517424 RepID=A0A2P8HEG8_9BACI|nr:ABC transporter permease [Salsuginibacillus halophilus]PSL44561.1 ABC-2 type transport system permease protein [Salsuginibacillus halophilus]
MASFINLLKNEHMKLFKRTGTMVMVAVMLLAVLGAGAVSKFMINPDTQSDWQAELEAENIQFENMLDESNQTSAEQERMQEQLALNNYRLENNKPPVNSETLWGFMIDASNLTGLAALFTIVAASSILAHEFSQGTIKLLLIRPVKRSKILQSKYVTAMMFSGMLLVLIFAFSFLTGSLLFGFHGIDQSHLVYQEGRVVEQPMFMYVAQLFSLNSVEVLMMGTFAFMVAAIFKNSSFAIGISIFLLFTGPQLVQVLNDYGWAKYILFAHTNLQQYIHGTPIVEGMTFSFSISMLVIYFVIFLTLAWISFEKRDVTA